MAKMAAVTVVDVWGDDVSKRCANNTSDAQRSDVFPLALTAFEKFFLWDDRAETPLTPIIELHFATRLNTEALKVAIGQVIEKNPTLNCIVEFRNGDLHWVRCDEPPKLWCALREPLVVDGMLRPFDLSKEPGSRFWYEEYEGGSRVLWQLHHAATDGIGMRPVVIDILLHYAMETDSENYARYVREVYCTRFRQEELSRRGDFSHLGAPKRGVTLWQRIRNAHYFHFWTPRPLLGTQVAKAVGTDPGCFVKVLCLASFDKELSSQVFAKCQAEDVAIHELATALLFRACAEWNRSLGDSDPGAHVRLMMPVDLRGRSDLRMPAANRLSFMFFGRSYQQCESFAELLDSVQKEFAEVKATQLYLDFLNAITAAVKWPRLMRLGLSRSRLMATAVLTYVGDVTRGTNRAFPAGDDTRPIGDATLTAILGAPPVRGDTNIAIGLGVNWGQINISAAWNRRAMSAEDCEKFLELYKSGWQRWCDEKE